MKPICIKVAITALVVLGLLSCSSNNERDNEDLEAQFDTLVALSKSMSCDNNTEWRFAGIGDKPCGGPTGYIAYSVRMDTVDFLHRLRKYNESVRERNIREGLVSDCALEPAPIGVQCQNGAAVLVYVACYLEPDSGPCEAAIPKYYYDANDGVCKEFVWGGCGGTVPFDTLSECKECEQQ